MSTTRARERVLLVEPDPFLALGLIRECLKLGLEPKLCRGPGASTDCPGLEGSPCERSNRIAATLVTVTSGAERKVAPFCRGGRLVVAGERPWVGAHTVGALGADVVIEYPYDPAEAAAALLRQVRGARPGRKGVAGAPVPEVLGAPVHP